MKTPLEPIPIDGVTVSTWDAFYQQAAPGSSHVLPFRFRNLAASAANRRGIPITTRRHRNGTFILTMAFTKDSRLGMLHAIRTLPEHHLRSLYQAAQKTGLIANT